MSIKRHQWWGRKVRTPQAAATPSPTMNATPMHRPETVLLLQPWSTEMTQAMNKRTAIPPNSLSHMVLSTGHSGAAQWTGKGSQSQGRVTGERMQHPLGPRGKSASSQAHGRWWSWLGKSPAGATEILTSSCARQLGRHPQLLWRGGGRGHREFGNKKSPANVHDGG